MMRSAQWRGMALPILCLIVTACGKQDARANANDPNAPAVVKAPPVVLASDTAKKEIPPIVSDQDALLTISRNYALAGSGLVMGDLKLILSAYAPGAEFITPNGKFSGTAAILKEWTGLNVGGSVKDFVRQSARRQVVDSTVLDSGTFFVTRKKGPGEPVTEQGAYSAVWRIQAPPLEWVMTKDHLYPASKKKRK